MRHAFAHIALGLLLLLSFRQAHAQQLPTGFSYDTLASGFDQPTGFALLPDGRMIVIEQRSAFVKVIAGGAVSTIGTVPNVDASAWEKGLLGVATDPAWPKRPYLYFYYTHKGGTTRVTMFAVTGKLSDPNSTALALGRQYPLLVDMADRANFHNAGTLRFGPDGMLYISVGDDSDSCSSTLTTNLQGAILRIDVRKMPGAGSGPPPKAKLVPPGNPFNGPNVNARLTYCFGLRNPFRFNIDSQTGALLIADVGHDLEEELDFATGGENFGWPWYEGLARKWSCPGQTVPTNLVKPIARYTRQQINQASIISMPRYRNRAGAPYNFGNGYEGSVFYAEHFEGFVRLVKQQGATWVAAPPVPGQPSTANWADGLLFVSDAQLGRDGAIYLCQQGLGIIARIKFTPQLPTLTVPSTVRAGARLTVRCQRNAGDPIYVAAGARSIPPTPLAGFFGRLAIGDLFPVAGGIADRTGTFALAVSVPAGAAGVRVWFQCVAVVSPENYLSSAARVTVVP